MDIKKVTAVSILILGVCVIPGAYADQKPEFSERYHEKIEKNIQEIYDQLNLSPEQKKNLKDNKIVSRQKSKALFEKMRGLRETLNQELMKPNLDMATITETQNNIKALQAQMADERLESILTDRKILSAEQFANFIGQMEKVRKEHRGKEEKE